MAEEEKDAEKQPQNKRGLIGCAVVAAVVAVAIAVAGGSGLFGGSSGPPTCGALVRQIVRLSEQNENALAGRILKLSDISEVSASGTEVRCRGFARRSRGGDVWLIFHWEVDADGDAFIGYRPE